MDNNTPVAPTDAQAPASVATPTNSNEQASAAAPSANESAPVNSSSEPTPEQMAEYAAKYYGTSVETAKKIKTMAENNKGMDNFFGVRKKEVSTPLSERQPQAPVQQAQPLPQQATTPNGLNMEYIEGQVVKDYFKELAEKPEYANIASQLRDGTVMEEASKRFGIQPIANGKINEGPLKDFCDMYSKTMPAAPAQAPMTNTPTVQPTAAEFTGPINSSQDALKVIQEHNAMVAAGKGDHPKYAEAQKFLNQGFSERHKPQQGFEPWAARKARQQQ